ncbi:GNAT family N-acetyltransferase [Virgibacillus sp. NKC19-3]|uniref:GNAT family N-acetyltransferase n=1 Tax=Virgibacillus saliphilus TaxID=2831674 RepID=UPI001C9B2989|nr:GNAT family N-acetyltransferase [Virgibacillus sp. NKC19-3]MBY7143945.1 GNAT family N-acetyltransferase [Virgibacillus sp. NKC19-3]
MLIRKYRDDDCEGWVRCRVLAFLDTSYYDNVLKEKEKYENPAIELVAVYDDKVIGLIDIEYEVKEGTVCSRGKGLGGMIWHIAVHPDFRRQGIGNKLFIEAENIAKDKGLNRLEAWTRDDDWVNKWYEKNTFSNVDSYLHVFMDGASEMKGILKSELSDFYPIQVFGHYMGDEKATIRNAFNRVHEFPCYEKKLY